VARLAGAPPRLTRLGAVPNGDLGVADEPTFDYEKGGQRMNERESTTGGPLGKLAGRAKEAAGSILGREDLQREGKLQQVQSEAEREAAERAAEAEQKEREAELAEERAEVESERREVELEAGKAAADERAERQLAEEKRAAAAEQAGGRREAAEAEQEARRAERAAAAVDPREETR